MILQVPSLKLTAKVAAKASETLGLVPMSFLLGPAIFSGAFAVSFREGTIEMKDMYASNASFSSAMSVYQECIVKQFCITNLQNWGINKFPKSL